MKTADLIISPRLLLVEDSLPVRQRIRSLIEECCHAKIVGEAATVAEAIALFHTLQPQVVVLDLQLADGPAYPVLREIKATRPACVVIMLTNQTNPEYRETCRALGADYFFNKSTEFDRVPEVLAGFRPTDSTGL